MRYRLYRSSMIVNRSSLLIRRRGTALAELAMSIPLLATVIALIFFFGYAMKNQQHVIASSRYAAWRAVDKGSPPSGYELNAMFFQDRASTVTVTGGGGPRQTLYDLVDKAYWESASAGDLMGRSLSDWPAGKSANVRADFVTSLKYWQELIGPIGSLCVRDGEQWRREVSDQDILRASYLEPIRNQFLSELDEAIGRIPDRQLSNSLKALYQRRW